MHLRDIAAMVQWCMTAGLATVRSRAPLLFHDPTLGAIFASNITKCSHAKRAKPYYGAHAIDIITRVRNLPGCPPRIQDCSALMKHSRTAEISPYASSFHLDHRSIRIIITGCSHAFAGYTGRIKLQIKSKVLQAYLVDRGSRKTSGCRLLGVFVSLRNEGIYGRIEGPKKLLSMLEVHTMGHLSATSRSIRAGIRCLYLCELRLIITTGRVMP
ncbi:hypothetical protein Moror_4455 [Moniliophthora roreri MCA 2997]|uniref:Uncharacterized protein n=1 Tax=Moniliophthora roreri (strain MCA 2997) TaxID=1381753 RepID=V2XFK8_MONRO|nr:hypothetical protein Moror_4455 [Moniliophthora roreri MCA 2997]